MFRSSPTPKQPAQQPVQQATPQVESPQLNPRSLSPQPSLSSLNLRPPDIGRLAADRPSPGTTEQAVRPVTPVAEKALPTDAAAPSRPGSPQLAPQPILEAGSLHSTTPKSLSPQPSLSSLNLRPPSIGRLAADRPSSGTTEQADRPVAPVVEKALSQQSIRSVQSLGDEQPAGPSNPGAGVTEELRRNPSRISMQTAGSRLSQISRLADHQGIALATPRDEAAVLATLRDVTPEDLSKALMATAAQRGITYAGGHLAGWAVQAATLMGVRAIPGATNEQAQAAATVIGGVMTALIKEVLGEYMKTKPSLGASIQTPSTTTFEKEIPRVVDGFNDSWTSVASDIANTKIGATLTPVVEEYLRAHGTPEWAIQNGAIAITAGAKRATSAVLDTLSDVTATLMKGTLLPGVKAANAVNEKFDTVNAVAGTVARSAINLGLSLPVGIPTTLGKTLQNAGPFTKTAASNALAWTGLNFWVVAKAHLAEAMRPAMEEADQGINLVERGITAE